MAAPSPKARCHVQQIQGHIVQQNVSCFTRTCFFRSRPANRAEELGARAEELELRTHIFLRVKYGFTARTFLFPWKHRQCSLWMQFSLQSFSRLAPICRKRHLASGLGADLQMFPTGQVTENILQLGKLARGGRTAFIQKSGGGCQANSIFSIWFYLTFSSQITHQKRNVRNLLILLLGGRDVKDKKDGKVDHCMSKQCFFC